MAYKIKKVNDKRERRTFSKIKNAFELQDLLEIQKKSYQWFLTDGIKEVLDDLFPVESFSGELSLEFTDYSFDEYSKTKEYASLVKYDEITIINKDIILIENKSAELKINFDEMYFGITSLQWKNHVGRRAHYP